MKRIKLCLSWLLLGIALVLTTTSVGYAQEISLAGKKYVPGQLIWKGNLEVAQQFFHHKHLRLKQVQTLSENTYLGIFQNQNLEVEKLAQQLESFSPEIVFAEENRVLSIHDRKMPKDTYWLEQWALNNIGQDSPSGSQGKEGADISILPAWKENKGSEEIIVAVVDTGIDYTHPDLKDNVWINEAELKGVDGKDDDGNGYTDDKYGWNFVSTNKTEPYHGQLGHPDPMDDHMHGTHCAGIIGAKPNNYKGIAGVNWNVKLMALKFMTKDGFGSTADAYRAIKYAIKNKVDVLSNSWGGGSRSDLLLSAIREAHDNGILFVAAAGNSAENNDDVDSFPSNYDVPNVVAVAATDNKDRLASFSSYGASKVHLAAPGVDIISTIPLSKADKDKFAYASFSGTSMATPFVAGAAALVVAANPELKKKPEAIKKRLMATVDVLPHLSGRVKSQGRLNVHHALINKLNTISEQAETLSGELDIEAPRYNEELFDKTWKIEQKGAKQVRIHFSWLVADIPDFDLIAIYDSQYRLIYRFEKQYPEGVWSPWVEGDTILVRFANALVAMEKYEEKEFSSPKDGFKAGAVSCVVYKDENKTICHIPTLSDPYANFESEGFHIDKLEYRTMEKKNEEKDE